MKKLNIAMLALHLPQNGENSGVDYQVHYLSNELVSFGHKVMVFSLSEKPIGALYDVKRIVISRRVKRNVLLRAIVYPIYLRLQKFDDFDIIHSHGNDYLFFMFSKPILRTFYGTALLESFYAKTISRKIYQFFWYLLEYLSGFNAKYISAISKGTKRYLPFVNAIVPCGVNYSLFLPGEKRSRNPSILFIGTMRGRKRGNYLLSVFRSQTLKKIPSAELWLVSDQVVSEKNVRSFGRISSKKLIGLYQRAWIYCSVSKYEGFGVPYIEALACGAPILTTRNKGALEVLKLGRYGIIVDDVEIGDALTKLLLDDEMRKERGIRGREYAKEFCMEEIAKKYEKIYFKLLRGNSSK